MAIKAYNLLIDKEDLRCKPRVLIYGTGKAVGEIMSRVPPNIVNIRAYVNSNPETCMTMFHRRLVITPDLIRLFPHDKIIISSRRYYAEMKSRLLEDGIAEEKITDGSYLVDLAINEISA